MLDVKKLKIVKLAGYVLLLVVFCMVAFGIGQSMTQKTSQGKTDKLSRSVSSELTQKEVKNFLLNYYTKKDLGENRKRYKDYMTDALYQQTVAMEEEPQNQTYKGFVVDFEFKDATIYIDQSDHQVIVQVSYVNTQLDEKKNYDTAQKDVMNHVTLRLTYVDDQGKLKVNKMESIILTDQSGNYGQLDNSSSSQPDSSK